MNGTADRLLNVLMFSWAGLVLSIVGIIVALTWMSTHRKAAMLVLISMSLMLINSLRYPIVEMFFVDAWRQRGFEHYLLMMRINNVVGQFVFLMSGVILLWGAFSGRRIEGPAFPLYPPSSPAYPRPPIPPQV